MTKLPGERTAPQINLDAFATRATSSSASISFDPKLAAEELRGNPAAALVLGRLIEGAHLELASQFLEHLIDSAPGENLLQFPDNAVDIRYSEAMAALVPDSVIENIRVMNASPLCEQDLQDLVDKIYTGEKSLKQYIENKATSYTTRFHNEYSLFLGLNLSQVFPYKYITDYSYKYVPCESEFDSLSIQFIYCIKNRVKRTSLSLLSLDRALKSTSLSVRTRFDVKVIVVEDVSDDILEIENIDLSHVEIDHYLVDTGISWTRSGLLNYGIRQSSADILAFVDADFLFHEKYFEALFRVLQSVEWKTLVLANNLIETEAHNKGKHLYSAASPYSYLWMAPRDVIFKVHAFDEGYSGHGFEDRDFEFKLTKLGGLTASDTISIDPDCFVLHLSHDVRDGIENQSMNKARYLQRMRASEANPESLSQPTWGVQILLNHAKHLPGKKLVIFEDRRANEVVDFLFVPHNGYHAKSSSDLCKELDQHGFNCKLLNISPPHPFEGITLKPQSMASIADLAKGLLKPRFIVVFNDWEDRIVRLLIDSAHKSGIETVGIVEGVNDFDDIDTGKRRSAYRRVHSVVLNGRFDQRHFDDSQQRIFIGGVQRLDQLIDKKSSGERERVGPPTAVINVNFSYGALANHREAWIKSAIRACKAAGFDIAVSQHIADTGPLFGARATTRPLYLLFDESDVVISRFSGVILEALAASKNVIYFNPAVERIDKFADPLGGYAVASTEVELVTALNDIKAGKKYDPSSFLALHCDIKNWRNSDHSENRSLPKTARILSEIEKTPLDPDYKRFGKEFLSGYVKESRFVPNVADETQRLIVEDLTFGIKSFGRSQHLGKLVNSILTFFPGAQILVVDDSNSETLDLPSEVRVIRAQDFDIGLSAGRNLLITNCETEYFVLLDDDFIFTEKTRIDEMLQVLISYDLDIVGGSVYDVGPSAQKKDQPRTFYGSFDFEADGTFRISTGKVRGWSGNAPVFDLVLNFFVSKTSALKRVKWRDELKLGEHLDFFIRARDLGLKISYVETSVVDHYRDHSANTDEYKEYRRRADEFHILFKKMHNINRIVLNTDEIPG